jgi:hypothetical protein
MARRDQPTGVRTYYEALQKIFSLQSEILTGAIPHRGERGRNDEERLRDFLAKVLPRKFSVGSGFLVCSNPDLPPSRETDVVIYDEVHNSPLHRELSAYVYPVEIVYATVEVKGVLENSMLPKVLDDIGRVRTLAKEKRYLVYGSVPKTEDKPDERVTQVREIPEKLPPRAYLFAYEAKNLGTFEDFRQRLQDELTGRRDVHLHGTVVLKEDWFFTQEPFTGERAIVHGRKGDSLLRFVSMLIHSMGSFPMGPASIDRYIKLK